MLARVVPAARTGDPGAMRWAAVLVGIAAGCFDPNVQPGAPCTQNGFCPNSLICVNGTCERPGGGDEPDASIVDDAADSAIDAEPEIDAMVDAMMMPNDNDGDGVVNMQDNCVGMANADHHDEDNDSVGDV